MNGSSFNKKQFQKIYYQSVDDIFQHWTSDMQAEISRHCYPWREGVMDFKGYLTASETRYQVAYKSLCEPGDFDSLCDIGGFYGVFPLTLARLGHTVTMTEALKYYSYSFDPLFTFLQESGVNIINYDPFDEAPPPLETFDVVTVLAVLEHYPHSLQRFMANVMKMLKNYGEIYIEVPNIAYWPKRKALLQGITPLVHISEIYYSANPFIGHHHEFTMDELKVLAKISGLDVLKSNYFNYSFRGPVINRVYSNLLLTLMTLIPSMRECVAILASRSNSKPNQK